ncbi:MAG: methyltransferase domain-containing protein [Pedobacter sp.]|nr:MAG: methyltransferase domain-containing protein [Pedobacter sp.]
MSNLLTDREFWVKYWESKSGLSVEIPRNYLFNRQLEDIIINRGVKTAIELGGFPGYYAVFLKKYFNLEVTLLDYFVHKPITEKLLQTNSLGSDAINVVEADLFNYNPVERYDLVLSCGLIEHFNDTEDIIRRHINFLEPGGTLFITLPNFRGFNGWFQKKFDRDNYDKHNINCMDPELLAKICKSAGLEIIQSRFFGGFSLWLENEKEKSLGVRLFKRSVWLAGKLFTKIIPFESKQLSPYILIEAKRK